MKKAKPTRRISHLLRPGKQINGGSPQAKGLLTALFALVPLLAGVSTTAAHGSSTRAMSRVQSGSGTVRLEGRTGADGCVSAVGASKKFGVHVAERVVRPGDIQSITVVNSKFPQTITVSTSFKLYSYVTSSEGILPFSKYGLSVPFSARQHITIRFIQPAIPTPPGQTTAHVCVRLATYVRPTKANPIAPASHSVEVSYNVNESGQGIILTISPPCIRKGQKKEFDVATHPNPQTVYVEVHYHGKIHSKMHKMSGENGSLAFTYKLDFKVANASDNVDVTATGFQKKKRKGSASSTFCALGS